MMRMVRERERQPSSQATQVQRVGIHRGPSWKTATVDCMAIFSTALIAELQRPKQYLIDVFKLIIEEQMTVQRQKEEAEIRVRCQREMAVYSQVSARRNNMEVVTVGKDWTSNLLVYGRDPERMEWAIRTAMLETIACAQEITIITLNGREIQWPTCNGFRALLDNKFNISNRPNRIVILLEEFTPSMFFTFQRSGFVHDYRQQGVQINVICWSSTYLDRNDISIMREFFSNHLFIPSQNDKEDERVEETSGHSAVKGNNMVVHKSISSASDAGEVSAVVQKPNRDRKINDNIPEIQASLPLAENSIQYAGLQFAENNSNATSPSPPLTTGNGRSGQVVGTVPRPPLAEMTRMSNHPRGDAACNFYTEMQPVMREPKPIESNLYEIKPKQDEKPTSSTQSVFWTKKSESVKVAVEFNDRVIMPDENKAEKNEEGDKITLWDVCDKIAFYCVLVYATICD